VILKIIKRKKRKTNCCWLYTSAL